MGSSTHGIGPSGAGDPLATFVADLEASRRRTVESLAAAVLSAGPPLDLAIKWRRLTFASAGDFHHWVCAIDVTRRGVALVLHFGVLLDDPDGRLRRSSSPFLGQLDMGATGEVDPAVVGSFVRAAVDRLPYFREHWRDISKAAAAGR